MIGEPLRFVGGPLDKQVRAVTGDTFAIAMPPEQSYSRSTQLHDTIETGEYRRTLVRFAGTGFDVSVVVMAYFGRARKDRP